MSTYQKALEIATFAHNGQKRWNGSPYINHPIEVSNMVNTEEEKIVALLHDTLEDCADKVGPKTFIIEGFSDNVINAIFVITKSPAENYLSYILRVKANNISRIVKMADLTHNLSDLDAKHHKSMKDKYELAYYILSHKTQNEGVLNV